MNNLFKSEQKSMIDIALNQIPCPHCHGQGWVAKPTRSERDELFDAISEVTGADPVVAGSRIGKLVSLCLKADPKYTADEIRRLPGVMRANGHTFRLTLNSFERYVGWLRTKPAGSWLFSGIQEWLEGQR